MTSCIRLRGKTVSIFLSVGGGGGGENLLKTLNSVGMTRGCWWGLALLNPSEDASSSRLDLVLTFRQGRGKHQNIIGGFKYPSRITSSDYVERKWTQRELHTYIASKKERDDEPHTWCLSIYHHGLPPAWPSSLCEYLWYYTHTTFRRN